jgi:cobalt-zinc-cadmium efflux system outer membrane protein
VAVLAIGLCGCAAYTKRPLHPAQAAHDFERRTLATAGLCDYLRANADAAFSTCPPRRWNLAALTLAGLYYSPDLAVAEARLRVAQAAVITAAERPNPSFGLGPAYAATAAPNFTPWAIGAAELNFPIETAGKRGYRINQARRLADAATMDVGEAAWRVRDEVRTALLNYLAARREYDLARSYESASADIARALQQRVSAGAAAAPDLNFALANLAAARLTAAQARSRVPETLNTLATAIGIPAQALQGADFVWPDFDHPPDETALTTTGVRRMALLNRIDLRRMLAEYAAADEALKLEIARQYPDINLGGGYSWEVNENLFELIPVVTVPLMNHNQGPIAQARARRAQIAAEFVALQDGIIGQASGALVGYRGALAAFAQGARSAAFAQKRLAGMRRAADLGDIDALTLATARLATIAAEQSRMGALANAQAALGTLENAVQRPLESDDLKSFAPPASLQDAYGRRDR